jgi:hypothetical protein
MNNMEILTIIISAPMELRVLLASGVVFILIALLKDAIDLIKRKTKRAYNPKTINPFALSTRLDGKTIKSLQRTYKNDR